MALYVNILTNKTGQQTTLDLVPVLSGMSVTTAKQAYVFGGKFRLSAGNNEVLLATADSSVVTDLGNLEQNHRLTLETMIKQPWLASSQVVLPSAILPNPLDATTVGQGLTNATQSTSSSYQYISLRDLAPSSTAETFDLTGRPAFVWYGQISLEGSSPLAIVTDGPLSLATFGASTTTVNVTPVGTSYNASTVALPFPDFDMLMGTFSRPKPFVLTGSHGDAVGSPLPLERCSIA